MKRISQPVPLPVPDDADEQPEIVPVSEAMPPGVYFLEKPPPIPADWKQHVLHVDSDGWMCIVSIAPRHTGPSFQADSRTWWEIHRDNPSGPHPIAFSPERVLRLVTPSSTDDPG